MLLEEKAAIPAVATQLEYLARVQESVFWEAVDLNQLEELRLRLLGLVPFLDKKERRIVYTDFQDEVLEVRDETLVAVPKMTGAQCAKKVEDYLRNHLDHIVIHRLRANQPLTELDLKGLEATLTEIGEEEGESLLSGLLTRSGAPSLAHFIRGLVGMDRTAAQAAFSRYLNDRSLTVPQIRSIETIIDQLTARGVMDAAALYEPPFSNLHAGGPDALFAGKENVIDAVFRTLKSLDPLVQSAAG
jgi:type I restriction enzyme R subunit